jgi:hypothetical protein
METTSETKWNNFKEEINNDGDLADDWNGYEFKTARKKGSWHM